MAKASSPTRQCGEDGCSRPHRARGLCSTHYNQRNYTKAQRHPTVVVACGWCGAPCEKGTTARYAKRFCGLECRDTYRLHLAGKLVCPVTVASPAHPRYGVLELWVAQTPRPRSISAPRTRWVAGRCQRCGAAFVDAWLAEASSVFCSRRCRRGNAKRRYRTRLHGGQVEAYRAVDVYRRDGWRCHICHRKVRRDAVVPHPLAPTIDHLVPVARDGDDVLINVACAHFKCNSRKSHLGGAQLLLFGNC